MNRQDMNWLLETINDPENAKHFVLAQYECGRISLQVMTDVAEERGWVKHTANQFTTALPHHAAAYATTGLTIAVA
jgi:hypothetical protein